MWKTLKSKILFRHPRLTVAEDDVLLPNGKIIRYLHHVDRKDAAIIICFRRGKLLVQKEYSYPVNKALYQFPGGAVEQGETPADSARRELHEEANLLAGSMRNLGGFYIDNRRTDAKMHVFLVVDPHDDVGIPDEEEVISSEWISIADFKQRIKQGEIQNWSMLAAWSLLGDESYKSK
jgi:8-oxo-dGTP pyrophosphatase MutT (NUDIX family)